ncbi:MAG: phosphodiester glycosidase family protein [Planctomycetota bacterium]
MQKHVILASGGSWLAPGQGPGSAPPPVTFGERVNGAIDELMAFCDRLLELPLFALVLGAGVLAGLVVLLLARRGSGLLSRVAGAALLAMALVGIAVVGDRRLARLQDEVGKLRAELRTGRAAASPAPPPIPTPIPPSASTAAREPAPAATAAKPAVLVDLAAATAALLPRFPGVTLKPVAHGPAVEIVQLHVDAPLIEAFVAAVDLADPAVAIAIGGTLEHKTMTSDFGSGFGCFVAINGEAGESPAPAAPLGQWRGNLVVGGEVQSREDPAIPRPFLWFDAAQRAHFVAGGERERALTPAMHDAMWGRLDAVVGGTVMTADERNRQPRTAMGIDAEGRRLLLLVVDGRQPRYSMGATRAEVGYALAAFGAHDGMLCDEGGSSCMYLRDLRGVVNSPSDFRGQERPTYTHFGIVVKS